jgi:hypothetical protein
VEPAAVDNFLHKLALTESTDNPDAPLGDDGRALGRYQVHPDWLDCWSKHYQLPCALSETWDSWVARIVGAFYRDHSARGYSDVEVAMYYHLGHPALASTADWDAKYAKRFLGET